MRWAAKVVAAALAATGGIWWAGSALLGPVWAEPLALFALGTMLSLAAVRAGHRGVPDDHPSAVGPPAPQQPQRATA